MESTAEQSGCQASVMSGEDQAVVGGLGLMYE